MARGRVVPLIPRIPAAEDARPKGMPLARLIELHRTHRLPQLGESTQATYRQTYQLLAALDTHPSIGEVDRWVTWLRSKYAPPEGFSDSWTVHLHWHNAAALYEWGKMLGHVWGCNPAACLQLPKPKARARAIIDVHDLWPAVLGACYDLRERTLLQAALDLGARRGELLGLMPHDLLTLGEPWRMRFERQRPKPNRWETTPLKVNGGNRAVPVSAELRTMLVELLAQGAPQVWTGRGRQKLVTSPFLFPYRNQDLEDLRGRLGAVAPTAFPPGDFLHAIRHTFAVELNRSGASDEEVQHALGHTSTQSTRLVYINTFARPVDAAPFARLARARRHGVVKWGAPPGTEAPPGVGPPAARRSGAPPAGTGEAPRPAETFNPSSEKISCRTPRKSEAAAQQRSLPRLGLGPVVTPPRRPPKRRR